MTQADFNNQQQIAAEILNYAKISSGVSETIEQLLAPLIKDTDNFLTSKKNLTPEIKDFISKSLETLSQTQSFIRIFKSVNPQYSSTDHIILNVGEEISSIFNIFRFVTDYNTVPELEINSSLNIKADQCKFKQLIFTLFLTLNKIMKGSGNINIEVSEQHITNEQLKKLDIPIKEGNYSSVIFNLITQDDKNKLYKIITELIATETPQELMGFSAIKKTLKELSAFYLIENTNPLNIKLLFPLYISDLKYNEKIISSTIKENHKTSYTVLVAEDNEMVRKLACNTLKGNGYTVIESSTPSHALELSRQTEIDLLLTDVIMPEMNGPELYKQIAEFKPDVKVLFMSAFSSDLISNTGFEETSKNFLQKPFTIAELIDKVKSSIKSR